MRPSSVGPHELNELMVALATSRTPLVTASATAPTVITFLASAS